VFIDIQVHVLRITTKLELEKLWADTWLLSCEVCFFVYCVIKRELIVRPDQTLSLYKNAPALVVTVSHKGNQFMRAVFSKSVVLRTKMSFNKSEAIAL